MSIPDIALFEFSVVTEIVPEITQRVPPGLIQPGSTVTDAGLCGGSQSHRSPLLGLWIHTFGVHEDALDIPSLAEHVPVVSWAGCIFRAVAADEVLQRATDRCGHRFIGAVCQNIPQDRHGQAAGLGVAGDKWVKGLDPHSERHVRIGKHHLSQRVGGSERTLSEAR